MSYNILGINTSHNGSVCVLKDGEIDFFLEEERVTKIKYDSLPLKLLSYISSKYHIDEIVVSGISYYPFKLNEFILNLLISKYFNNTKINYYFDQHHLTHSSSSFFNSPFKKSLCITIDGSGSVLESFNNNLIFETESVYKFSRNSPPFSLYKSYITTDKENFRLSLSKVYKSITMELGFGIFEAGKTMGLSSYGKPNPQIPPLYIGTEGNPEVFGLYSDTPNRFLSNKYKYLILNPSLRKDLAFKVQQESQQAVGDLIEKRLKETGLKQVCCSGGYFLNCVANYYLIKRFPDIEFYFEPISSDAGTSIGAAKLAWYEKTQDTTIRPQKTLYYGPQYSKEELLNGIKKYL